MIQIAALYHFAKVPDPARFRGELHALAEGAGLMGTLLIAPEGVNGTLAGSAEGLDRLIARIRAEPGFEGLVWKGSHASEMPFGRLKVRLKREIVTMGQPGLDPTEEIGRAHV